MEYGQQCHSVPEFIIMHSFNTIYSDAESSNKEPPEVHHTDTPFYLQPSPTDMPDGESNGNRTSLVSENAPTQ
eukprot:7388352-Ditylum_brightwellii.AAC.1